MTLERIEGSVMSTSSQVNQTSSDMQVALLRTNSLMEIVEGLRTSIKTFMQNLLQHMFTLSSGGET